MRDFWRLAGILLAGKVLYLAFAGISYEADTATYLSSLLPFHHPPLYAMLLHLLRGIYPDVYLVGAVQVALFALAGALLIARFVPSSGIRYVVAAILALEPATSFFCANLMSEGLFVPLLMVWTVLVDAYLEKKRGAAAIGLIVSIALAGALLYATRLVGAIFVPLVPLLHLLRHRRPKTAATHALVLLLAFQAMLVPFKLAYLNEFGSYSMSLFRGTPLWNSASALYPDSSVRTNPTTEFERFLAGRDADEFTTDAALTTMTLFDPGRAYEQFLTQRPRSPEELRRIEKSLARTSIKIILENPWGLVSRFIVPNFVKVLTTDEPIVIPPYNARVIEGSFREYRQEEGVVYRSRTWALWLAGLVLVTGLRLLLRRGGAGASLLLLLAWYHTLVLPVISVIFIRYMLIVVPWVLLAGCLVATRPAVAVSGSRSAAGRTGRSSPRRDGARARSDGDRTG